MNSSSGWIILVVLFAIIAGICGWNWYESYQTIEKMKWDQKIEEAKVATGVTGDKEEIVLTHKDYGTLVVIAGQAVEPEDRRDNFTIDREGNALIVMHTDRSTNEKKIVMRRGDHCASPAMAQQPTS